MNKKQTSICFFISYAIIIIGAIIHILGHKIGFYTFGIGCLTNTLFRIKLLPQSRDIRIRRLNNQQFIIVACFIGTAYLMYKHHSAWALPLLIASVIEIFLTYRYPKTDNKK